MSTYLIDTAYGQICCAAVHHFPRELSSYRAHLVHRMGDDAPTLEEIKSLGAEVSAAWGMGVNPQCFLCGDDVAKGTGCHCLLDALPMRMPKAQAEALVAKGEKSAVACTFTCAHCGCMDTMTAEQILRTNGEPYVLCRRDAKKNAMIAKAAKASHNAEAAKLVEAARATARAEIAAAQRAYDGACTAKKDADLALMLAARSLNAETLGIEETTKIVKDAGGSEADIAAHTAAGRRAAETARRLLGQAQQRYEATVHRMNATRDQLTLVQRSMPSAQTVQA
jgi:hypothetical protein